MRIAKKSVQLRVVLSVAAAAGLATTAFAQNAPRATAQTLTDQQVLNAIKKGATFLLNSKKVDNFESGNAGGDRNLGGETALCLYALLHVGESVQDEDEIGPKLKFNSPELTPVVRYVAKMDTAGTYTAGLQASALALVNRNTDLGKEAAVGLETAKKFIVEAMGADGGYAYTAPRAQLNNKEVDFDSTWLAYCDAKSRNDGKAAGDARQRLEGICRALSGSFAGITGRLQLLQAELRTQAAEGRQKKDLLAVQRAEFQLRELEQIGPALLRVGGGAQDFSRQYAEALKNFDDAKKAMQTGGFKDENVKDAAGNDVKDAKGNVQRRRVPKTADELKRELENARSRLEAAEFAYKNNFHPIGDLSNGQYGTLGAWALSDLNIELPSGYWKVSDRFWRLTQKKNGGWGYQPLGDQVSPSMTVAGLASLFITSDQVETVIRLEPKPDLEIERGLAWLNANFTVNAGMYYLYGLERAGLASGLKSFDKANTNWYKDGAAYIVNAQSPDGSWNNGGFHGANPNITTAYALLFLARGRNAVVFNKLQYDGPWNARPRDNANITAWMSKKFEKPINWQIVSFKIGVEEWQDAPVLLITGSKPLKFSPDEIAKLKAYVDAGGIIFSCADGGDKSVEFTESIKKVAGQLVLDGGKAKYEMRELKPDHVLFSQELWAQIDKPPRVLAMSNGVREIWVHSTVDMGASWQGRKVASRDHFEFPANLNRYASGKASLRSKLQPLTVTATKDAATQKVAVARIDYAGNYDPEPGAWPRLAKVLRVEAKTDVEIKVVKLAALKAKDTPIAHITGTTRIPASPDDVAALKQFLADGGMLFIDAAGGSQPFIQSALELLQQVCPGQTLGNISVATRLYNGTIPGSVDATHANYRRYFRLKVGNVAIPQFQAIDINGRHAVIFSSEDVTSGLLGTNTWGVLGYAPESSLALARNVVLYAMNPKAGWEGAPGTPNPAPTTTSGPATSTAPAMAPTPAPK